MPNSSSPGPGALTITAIDCLNDNYAYLIAAADDDAAWVVDPSEAAPVEAALRTASRRLTGILATHHHPDHVGGIAALVDARPDAPPFVAAHARDRDRVPRVTLTIDAPLDAWQDTGHSIAGRPLEARLIPGHTLGAIAWRLGNEVFTGDTLFAAGCGRLFEGTAAQMHASLRALCALPPATRLWFGHEYTAANLRFARVIEPDNDAIVERLDRLGPVTTPSTVALELATNPFVRADNAAVMGSIRTRKDVWRG